MEPRYILINVDKHQGDVTMTNILRKGLLQDADQYATLIIDLEKGERYYGGKWRQLGSSREIMPPDAVCKACGKPESENNRLIFDYDEEGFYCQIGCLKTVDKE